MKNYILLSQIAQQAGATDADIAVMTDEPLWQPMMRRDDDGRLWVPEKRRHYFSGGLSAEADIRKDKRIKDADANLVSSYAQLNRTSRRSRHGIVAAARRQQRTLAQALQVLDSLVELVDAKSDARRIEAGEAAEILAEVQRLRQDAQSNADHALKTLRSLLDVAA